MAIEKKIQLKSGFTANYIKPDSICACVLSNDHPRIEFLVALYKNEKARKDGAKPEYERFSVDLTEDEKSQLLSFLYAVMKRAEIFSGDEE